VSRQTDLERSIRDSYSLIHEYEDIIRLSDRPKEKLRARSAAATSLSTVCYRTTLRRYGRGSEEVLVRIAVSGTGRVGGYFGGRLAQVGEDVTIIARGEHLQAIRIHHAGAEPYSDAWQLWDKLHQRPQPGCLFSTRRQESRASGGNLLIRPPRSRRPSGGASSQDQRAVGLGTRTQMTWVRTQEGRQPKVALVAELLNFIYLKWLKRHCTQPLRVGRKH
jgi:hypothetical protein